jgi:hypothetical protein
VELLASGNETVDEYPSSLIYTTPNPRRIPSGCILLGFDVADSGLWSGLSNCGYSEEERGSLRPEWQCRIYDFGLLISEQDAIAFKEMSDVRVPEHAPLWTYRLYRLPEL